MAFLERGISEIQPHLRTAIEFRILEDLSAKETAAALGISVSAAKTRLFRARNELREQLKRGAPLALRHSKRKI
jgi:RNA polymerase sigma-70 factor (ECF subfamily)